MPKGTRFAKKHHNIQLPEKSKTNDTEQINHLTVSGSQKKEDMWGADLSNLDYVLKESSLSKLNDDQRHQFLDSIEGDIHLTYTPKRYTVNDKTVGDSRNICAISLFSGCGGLDIGAQLAGAKVISSLDFFKDSVETIKLNPYFREASHYCQDITKIGGSFFNKDIEKAKPSKLILIGGPPCQPFSKAGYWITNEKRLAYDDPRNMIGNYLRIIDDIQPDGFLLENVESILHPSNKEAVDVINDTTKSMGYNLVMYRLNAADYGIPQKRKRVFFLASKKPIKKDILQTHGDDKARLANPSLLPYERVIDWIGQFDTNLDYASEHLSAEGLHYEDLCCIPPGDNYIALSERRGYPNPKFVAGKRYWTYLLKLHPNLPSWTIIAGPGHWEGPFHWDNRRLSLRECAAIQTFPEDYQFYGGLGSQRTQIGNAVPPLLGKIVVESLLRWI